MVDRAQRRLAAIVAADVAGFSRLVGADEEGTIAAQRQHRQVLIDPLVFRYDGRIANTAGDSLLVEFPSAVEAVRCALAIQAGMAKRNADVPPGQRIEYRIGVNVGDVLAEGDDLLGDGVNIAARLEGLAPPGGIVLSRTARDQVQDRLEIGLRDLGEIAVKNIARPVHAFQIAEANGAPDRPVPSGWPLRRLWAGAAAVLLLALAGAALVYWQASRPTVEAADPARFAYSLPDRPSIAVLPFANLSGDPGDDFLADGLTEALITELSRFAGLFVIARYSVLAYAGQAVKVQTVAEELGVRFVLEGSVQRDKNRLRVTAQLIDAITGHHIWAERYDRDVTDIFAVQDDVTSQIVSQLGNYQGELATAVRQMARRKPPSSLSAYEKLQLGIEHKHRFDPEENKIAEALFREALELEPDFAQAYIGLAWIHIQRVWFGWTAAFEQDLAAAQQAAERAIALDPEDAEGHWLLGEALMVERKFARGEAAFRRALELNPNNADLVASWGSTLMYLGEHERAIAEIRKAMRLNPNHPDWYDRVLGKAYFMAGRLDEALASFQMVEHQVVPGLLYWAATLAELGKRDQAQRKVAVALSLEPDTTISTILRSENLRRAEDRTRLAKALALAGLPE